jgi:hypothetical protein
MKIKTTEGILEINEKCIKIFEHSELLDIYKILQSALMSLNINKDECKQKIILAIKTLESINL